MSLISKVVARIAADHRNTLDLASGSFPLAKALAVDLANGTGAGQADKLWSDRRTLAASATDSLDLSGTALVDAFGAPIAFARLKAILVVSDAENTNNIRIGGAASNGFATWVDAADNEVVLRPGGAFLLVAPDADAYAVTAGTGDLLEIVNAAAGTSVTYDIVLIGASA